MSKILVVQPDRMLQQAYLLALFPQHEVQMFSVLPDAAPIGFDAAIIDAVALREYYSVNARDLRKTQLWQVPIVWIDDGIMPDSADHINAARLERPVTRESLQKALAKCLRPPSKASGSPRSNTQIVAAPTKPKPKKAKASPLSNTGGKFIELVDVVEDGVATGVAMTKAKNKV